VDLGDVQLLTSPDGRALLAELAELPAGALDDPLPVLSRLRASGHAAALAAAAVTQARLRARGGPKLGSDAAVMIFTPDGYEQATRRSVAEHRAARLAAADVHVVADLCCGIGGDAVALARAGLRVVAVERDPATAAVARANVVALGLDDRVGVHELDARDATGAGLLDDVDAVFIDPARRSGRGRIFDPDAYSPPYSFVADLVAHVPAVVAKVAPGIPRDLAGPGTETEWVSDGGDVKEASLWHGRLAAPGIARRATLLPSGATLTDTDPSSTDVREPGRWLHEPDGAVIRAGLVGQAAARVGGGLLDASIAYVTTDADVTDPTTRRFEVLESMPFGLKPLRAALRGLDASEVVVKKRGSAIVPDELRSRLAVDGSGPRLVVVVTRKAGAPWSLICRPA